jgi:hypothetical protein
MFVRERKAKFAKKIQIYQPNFWQFWQRGCRRQLCQIVDIYPFAGDEKVNELVIKFNGLCADLNCERFNSIAQMFREWVTRM